MRLFALLLLLSPLAAVSATEPLPPATPAADVATLPVRMCVQETGTRLQRRASSAKAALPPRAAETGQQPVRVPMAHCNPGRTYTREDLERSGGTDLADALRRLDPAIH